MSTIYRSASDYVLDMIPSWRIQIGGIMTEKEMAAAPSKNGLGIASLVIGIIALITSPVPIINNGSAILAIIGLILGIIGLVMISKAQGKKTFTIIAIILNVVAFAVVLMTQSMYANAIDDALDGPQAVETEQNGNKDSANNDKAAELELGSSATLDNGKKITVTEVKPGVTADYGDEVYTRVTVKIENTGDDKVDFNSFNWHAEDKDGVQRDNDYLSSDKKLLESGNLAPGGSVTGNIYFEGDIAKVLYVSGLSDKTAASWNVSK